MLGKDDNGIYFGELVSMDTCPSCNKKELKKVSEMRPVDTEKWHSGWCHSSSKLVPEKKFTRQNMLYLTPVLLGIAFALYCTLILLDVEFVVALSIVLLIFNLSFIAFLIIRGGFFCRSKKVSASDWYASIRYCESCDSLVDNFGSYEPATTHGLLSLLCRQKKLNQV